MFINRGLSQTRSAAVTFQNLWKSDIYSVWFSTFWTEQNQAILLHALPRTQYYAIPHNTRKYRTIWQSIPGCYECHFDCVLSAFATQATWPTQMLTTTNIMFITPTTSDNSSNSSKFEAQTHLPKPPPLATYSSTATSTISTTKIKSACLIIICPAQSWAGAENHRKFPDICRRQEASSGR